LIVIVWLAILSLRHTVVETNPRLRVQIKQFPQKYAADTGSALQRGGCPHKGKNPRIYCEGSFRLVVFPCLPSGNFLKIIGH